MDYQMSELFATQILQIFRLRHKKYLKPRGNPRKSLLYGGHRKHQLEILYRLKSLQGLQRLSSVQCPVSLHGYHMMSIYVLI